MHEAQKEALAIAAANGYPESNVRRAIDTDYNDPCWVINEIPGGALVVYEDEPDTVVSIGNRVGRLV